MNNTLVVRDHENVVKVFETSKREIEPFKWFYLSSRLANAEENTTTVSRNRHALKSAVPEAKPNGDLLTITFIPLFKSERLTSLPRK